MSERERKRKPVDYKDPVKKMLRENRERRIVERLEKGESMSVVAALFDTNVDNIKKVWARVKARNGLNAGTSEHQHAANAQ